MSCDNSRELRARHRLGIAGGGWGRVSPSAELMVDPKSGAQCAIRDSRAPGAERYLWTLIVFGYHQLAVTAPEALQRHVRVPRRHWRVTRWLGAICPAVGVVTMAARPLVRFFWRVLDAVDYRVTQARLLVTDAVCDPEP
jgi:hypothetical protein